MAVRDCAATVRFYNRREPIPRTVEKGDAMPVILGTDGYHYEVSDNWAKLPPGMEFNADVAAVGVDKNDNVYAFNRGQHPMCVFDREGNLLRTWGEGIFPAGARRVYGAGRHDLAHR